MSFRILAVLVAFVLPGWISGESLGEAAKRERERREKNKQEGVTAKLVGQDDVREAAPARPTPTPRDGGSGTEAGTSRDDGEESPQASQWRSEARWAQDRVARARKRYEALERAKNDLVDADHEISRAKKDLETAEKQLADVEERARKAGVPPGWLR